MSRTGRSAANLGMVIVTLALAATGLVACERVVDLTPPDAQSFVPDAAVSEGDVGGWKDAGIGGGDGNEATPLDTFPPDAPTSDAF